MHHTPSFSLVLPVRLTKKRHEREYLTHLLLPSLDRFLEPEVPILVIAPDAQVDEVRQVFEPHQRLSPIYLSDSEVAAHIPADVKGWRRQQMLKLMVSHRVQTPCYITLDADVFLLRQVTADAVIRQGRLVTNLAPAARQMAWWRASSALLGVEPPGESERAMSVTPAALVTEQVRSLIVAVRERHGGLPMEEVLAKHKFTEYTLYWSFLRSRGLHDQLYITEGPGLFRALWQFDPDASPKEQFLDYVKATPTLFGLVQSSNRLRPRQFLPEDWDVGALGGLDKGQGTAVMS